MTITFLLLFWLCVTKLNIYFFIMAFEWSFWYVFVLKSQFLFLLCVCMCVCFLKKKKTKNLFFFSFFGYYMSLREVRKCKLFRKGQLLKILTFYFDKFTNIFIFWRNEAHKYFCILINKHTHT